MTVAPLNFSSNSASDIVAILNKSTKESTSTTIKGIKPIINHDVAKPMSVATRYSLVIVIQIKPMYTVHSKKKGENNRHNSLLSHVFYYF